MVVQLGDLNDQHTLGRFDPEPDARGTCEELEAARDFNKKLAKLFQHMTITLGNHDTRVIKRMKKVGIPSAFYKDLAEVYGAPASWKYTDEITINGIRFFHGDGFSGPSAALKAAELYRQSVMIGHVHAAAGVAYSTGTKDSIWGACSGCLVDNAALAFAYGKTCVRKPVLGASVVVDGVPYFIPMR